MGVALYNKTIIKHHINHYTLFPLHPPLMNLDLHRIFQGLGPNGNLASETGRVGNGRGNQGGTDCRATPVRPRGALPAEAAIPPASR